MPPLRGSIFSDGGLLHAAASRLTQNHYAEQCECLLHVLPMPRLIEVWPEAEAVSVSHQPLVNWCIHLDRAVGVLRVDRITADIQIQSATSEMRTVQGKAGAAGVGRFAPQF